MAKQKNPLFSFKAQGGLGDAIAMRHSRRVSSAIKKPIPTDIKSLAQLSWRHMYQKAVALWHALSGPEQQEWESSARRKHMTGFAWFMSQALKPNPGLYLPLQGGVMAGDIDMAKNRLLKLPAPVDAQEPLRLGDGVAVHGAEKHTDKTRWLFLQATAGNIFTGISKGYQQYSSVMGTADEGAPYVMFSIKVPSDFVSFISMNAWWATDAVAGDAQLRMYANYCGCAELTAIHTEDTGYGVVPTIGANILICTPHPTPLTLPNLSKDDLLGIYFRRVGSMAADTLDAAFYLLGLLFTYTAEQ